MSNPDDLVVWSSGHARFQGRALVCAVGAGGFTTDKREGDGAAPTGRFAIERIFYRPDRVRRPRSAPPVQPIRRGYGWSDDPCDPAYNTMIRTPWPHSHEAMWRADRLYDLVAVLDINRRPAQPGRGSALFLHVWRAPRRKTAGCVAFRRADLEMILAGWRSTSRVVLSGATGVSAAF